MSNEPDEASGAAAVRQPLNLEQALNVARLIEFGQRFERLAVARGSAGGLDIESFRTVVREVIGKDVTDEESDSVFFKVNVNGEKIMQWQDYMNYLKLVTGAKHKMAANSSQPFSRDIRFVKTTSHKRIVGIMLMPIPKANKSGAPVSLTESANGRYLGLSESGLLTTWTTKFTKPVVQQLTSASCAAANLCITCAVFMPAANALAIATTNSDLLFFVYSGEKFERVCRVSQLPATVTCISYHCDAYSRGKPAYLSWGDDIGGLASIAFNDQPETTRLCSVQRTQDDKDGESIRSYLFVEICNKALAGVHARYLAGIHHRLVTKVRFIESRRTWISCCHDSDTALFIGDLVLLPRSQRHQYYKIDLGVETFDYCRTLNMIITGGITGRITLWNPDAKSANKLVGHLDGHTSPVIHMEVIKRRELLFSVAENKDVRIYDLATQSISQVFFRKAFSFLGPRPVTSCCVNQVTLRVAMSSKVVAILDMRCDDPKIMPLASHNRPITVILYNALFKQLVSADQNSLVCVWDVMTGNKVIEFTAHTAKVGIDEIGVEITSMTFDPEGRRLMTSFKDGGVKLWNFNNGCCLRTLWKPNDNEVSCVAWAKGRILTAGWNHRVILYPDLTGQNKARGMKPVHDDDVISLAVFPPRYAASGCVDGTIMIWSLETSHPLFKFFANDTGKQATNSFKLEKVVRNYKIVFKDDQKASTRRQSTKAIVQSPQQSKVLDEDDESEEVAVFEYVEVPPPDASPDAQTNFMFKELMTELIVQMKEAEQMKENEARRKMRRTSSIPATDSSMSTSSNDDPLAGLSHADVQRQSQPRRTVAALPTLIKSPVAVEQLIFLQRRTLNDRTAMLLSCMSNGQVLGWPMDGNAGRCLGRFAALSRPAETFGSAAVTEDNEFLIIGDSAGYIKMWDISHYLVADIVCDEDVDRNRWNVWRNFPFVAMRITINWIPRFRLGGPLPLHLTQRCTRTAPSPSIADEMLDERPPHLINCFRGHLSGISSLTVCNLYKRRLVASASSDLSVRLWTLEGQFLGVCGRPDAWTDLGPLATAPMMPGPPRSRILKSRRKSVTAAVDRTMTKLRTSFSARRSMTVTGLLFNPMISNFEQFINADQRQEPTKLGSVVEVKKPCMIGNVLHSMKRMMDEFTDPGRVADDFDKPIPRKRVVTDNDEEEDEEPEDDDDLDREKHPPFNVDLEMVKCRERRKVFNVAIERDVRIMSLDPKTNLRVTMVTLDSSKASLPADIRRTASYTTLYVLETGLGSRSRIRWVQIRQALCWMVCYWESRRTGASMTNLVKGEALQAVPFGNMLKDMIETYEKAQRDAMHLSTDEGSSAEAQAQLDKLGLTLKPPGDPEAAEDVASEDDGTAVVLGQFGRKPLTKSAILSKTYTTALTRYRPPPPMKPRSPVKYECSPYNALPYQPAAELDGCRIALTNPVKDISRKLHLHALDCDFRAAKSQVDAQHQLFESMKQLGWYLASDGTLKRIVVRAVRSVHYKSLLPPLYSCDIEAIKKKMASDAKELADNESSSLMTSQSRRNSRRVSIT